MQRYERPVYDPSAALRVMQKISKPLDDHHIALLHELHHWRDTVARAEDESPQCVLQMARLEMGRGGIPPLIAIPFIPLPCLLSYVLPNHMLVELAARAPRESPGILACCQPIPPLVRLYAPDLATVSQARVLWLAEYLPQLISFFCDRRSSRFGVTAFPIPP